MAVAINVAIRRKSAEQVISNDTGIEPCWPSEFVMAEPKKRHQPCCLRFPGRNFHCGSTRSIPSPASVASRRADRYRAEVAKSVACARVERERLVPQDRAARARFCSSVFMSMQINAGIIDKFCGTI